jgi:hypothetical protein
MARYEENDWRRENVGRGPRSYDRDEQYGRPRMSWENDQDRGMSGTHRGGVWRDEGAGRGNRYEGSERRDEDYQRYMVQPERQGARDEHDGRYAASDDDDRSPRSYERERAPRTGWEREPSSSRGHGWYGSERARDDYDHYRGYARDDDRRERDRFFDHQDAWYGSGGSRSADRYDRGGYEMDRRPSVRERPIREHRPEDDFGKVSGRWDDERYSGSLGGRSAPRPSNGISRDAYGMRMVRPGDRPSHDRSNDDEHYGYGRAERGRFDQPEDDRYGRSRPSPYENNWR